MSNIKTWQERKQNYADEFPRETVMQAEIDELSKEHKALMDENKALREALTDFSDYVRGVQCSTDGPYEYTRYQINALAFKARAALSKG